MNPLSFPSTSKLSCQEWNVRLGHPSDKVVRSLLKQHVPSFELKTWQSFYCEGFRYLLTIRDNVSTFSIVYPLKSRSDAPAEVLDAITHLSVQLGASPKVLRTDNTREFTSGSFTTALTKLGIGFYPSLPYSPQENGKAERLNRTLGDMERAMTTKSGVPP
ncbi:hypothetical protein O181_001156 [Austropuccinia psidii MF-1]|uniref:Integrase catalytic domain-containing protein n=1 Tax=Austropuccinia psidii MF-1 TaxID=1389203 RepID=A0A9Q3GC56_9BASI|nr:hypothetical protein [Austropuccinia psidii MF-1]